METGEIYISQKDFGDIRVEKGDRIIIGKQKEIKDRFVYTVERTGETSVLTTTCNLIKFSILENSYEIY